MKTRFLKILALLLVLSCLFGCAPAQSPETQPPTEATTPPVEETEPPVEETRPPVALHYDYPEWNFSLTLPEQWAGKFSLEEDETSLTFMLGDTPILSFVTVNNEPGAKELNDRLIAEDYTFHHDNGSQALFYKELSDIPMEYQIYQRGLKKPILHTEDILEEFWDYNGNGYASQAFNVFAITAESKWGDHGHYYIMRTPHYVSYRLGIDFTLPEELMNQWNIGISFGAIGMSVNLLYNWDNRTVSGDPGVYTMYYMDYMSQEEFEKHREYYEDPAQVALISVFEDEVYVAEHWWFFRGYTYCPIPVPPYEEDVPTFEQIVDAVLELRIISEEQPKEIIASHSIKYRLEELGEAWDGPISEIEP